MNDVEILGRDRRAMQHGGSSPDDDELDPRSDEGLDQSVEVSLRGMSHAETCRAPCRPCCTLEAAHAG